MKKLLLLFCLIETLVFCNLTAQPVTFPWATGFGGYSTFNAGTRITRDDVGNTYAIGTFSATRTFGTISLTATGYNDAYIAKFDPTGNCMWAIKAGGSFSTANPGGIAIDNNYNIYVTGTFTNSITLGIYSFFATSSSSPDIFIARLDNNGNPIWMYTATGSTTKNVTYLHCDGNNLFLSGFFTGSATFGTFTVTNPSNTFTDIFLAKYDLNGSCLWANKAGGNQDDKAFCIKTDNAGNIILTGFFYAIATFGTNTVSSSAFDDFFVAKYDQSGNNLWVKKGGGAGSDQGYGVSSDFNNNIYVTGTFSSPSATFGTVTITDNGYGNIFIAKYDINGICAWAKSAGGGQSDQGFDISTDSAGSSYVTGIFQGSASFFPHSVSSTGSNDAFVAKYNTLGSNTWVTKIGGTNIDYGKSIVNSGGGNVVVAGSFTGSVTFGTINLTSSVGWGDFITEISGGTVGIENFSETSDVSFYPNPASNYLQVNIVDHQNKINELHFFNSMGQLILKKELESTSESFKINLDANLFQQGIYFVKVNTSKGESVQKLVIQNE